MQHSCRCVCLAPAIRHLPACPPARLAPPQVKDLMAHLYFKAKESFAQQAPKEVRILKYLLTIESERDRAALLAQAFEPGGSACVLAVLAALPIPARAWAPRL